VKQLENAIIMKRTIACERLRDLIYYLLFINYHSWFKMCCLLIIIYGLQLMCCLLIMVYNVCLLTIIYGLQYVVY